MKNNSAEKYIIALTWKCCVELDEKLDVFSTRRIYPAWQFYNKIAFTQLKPLNNFYNFSFRS